MLRCNLLLLTTTMLALAVPVDATAQQPAPKDAFGDPLPDGALGRLGTIRWHHPSQVTFAAFLPDGKTVISADMDRTIRVWEYPAGKELRRIGLPLREERSMRNSGGPISVDLRAALSKDGKTLAVLAEKTEILLFEVATGKKLQTLQVDPGDSRFAGPIRSLDFSPAGQHLGLYMTDGSARIWDWTKAKELRVLARPFPKPHAIHGGLVWSPDGKTLAALKEGQEFEIEFDPKIFDPAKGIFGKPKRGREIQAIEIWDPATGTKLRTVPLDRDKKKDGSVYGLCVSPNGKTLAFGTTFLPPQEGRITLVDVATGTEIRRWTHRRNTGVLLFSHDGKSLYGWSKDSVVQWDVANGKALRNIAVLESEAKDARISGRHPGAEWSPDGRHLLLFGGGNALQFVDVATGKEIGPGAGPMPSMSALQFTPDGKHLWSRTGAGAVYKWDAATGKPLDLPAPPKLLLHGPSSPDGKLVVASSSEEPVRSMFVDAATGKELGTLPPIKEKRAIFFSPDSKMLAVHQDSEKKITVYEAPSGKLLHALAIVPSIARPKGKGLNRAPRIVFFSPDSKTVAAFADPATLVLWNTTSGERVREFKPANATEVRGGAFSPDGRSIVLAFDDGRAILYDLASARVRRTYGSRREPSEIFFGPRNRGGSLPAACVAFGPDGHTLFHAGAEQMIHVWDVDSAKELAVFKGHTGAVNAIALTADGKTLGSASADNTVLFWDLTRVKRATPQQLAAKDQFGDPLPAGAVARLGTVRWNHGGQATFAAFLPDGKSVITAGADRTIRVWEYPSGKELRRIGRPEGIYPASRSDFPIALSKDAKTLAVSFEDEVVLFEVATGDELQRWKPGSRRGNPDGEDVASMAFSPTGQHLAIFGEDGRGRVWDWAKAKEVCTFADTKAMRNRPNTIGNGVAWSPDGKVLATIKDYLQDRRARQTIEICDPTTGKKVRDVALKNKDDFFDSVLGLVFSPDGKTLALGNRGGDIILADVATGNEIRRWKPAPDLDGGRPISSSLLLFSPDGAKLYGLTKEKSQSVVEWDVASSKALRHIAVARSMSELSRRSAEGGISAGWSPDGRVLVLAGGGSAPQFVDVAAGKEIDTGAGLVAALSALRFTADSKNLWTRNGNGSVHNWEAVTGKKLDLPALPKHLSQGLRSPDGKLLVVPSSAAPEGGAFVAVATGKELGRLPGLFSKISRLTQSMLFSPDSKMLAVRDLREKKITLYAAPSGKRLHTLDIIPVARVVPSIAPPIVFFSGDSKTLAAFADPSTLALWDTTSGRRVGELAPGSNSISVRSGAFSPDGRCIALDVGRPILYELASAQVRRTYGSQEEGFGTRSSIDPIPETRIAFGPSGQTLINAADRAIQMWDVDSGKELAVFKGHTGSVDAIALAADGKALASASTDNTVLVWNLTGIKRPAPAVKALAQSERDACWQTLLDVDAAAAFTAIRDLSASPEATLALLKERVKPAPSEEMKRIEALVAALESDQFKTRQEAKVELMKLDERAVPAIDRVLAKNPPLEFKRRLDEVRQHLVGVSLVLQGEPLRMYRAVEVLERIGTPEAGQLLQTLADGPPAPLTTTAQAALQRLK